MFQKSEKKPVTLITGYLGSGKTTLLNELLKMEELEGLALIVNDMGSVNIDASLVKKNKGLSADTTMVELQNGCICCTLQDAFMDQIDKLSKDKKITKIMVEASGISNPAAIAEGFLAYEERKRKSYVYLSSIVTVVDADRIYTEFLEGMEQNITSESVEGPDIINLVMDQIEFCNVVILNKCDLLEQEKKDKVKEMIHQLQTEADIIESIHGKVDPDVIFNGRKFDYEEVLQSSLLQKALDREHEMEAEGLHNYGITSFVFEEKKPFDRKRFMAFVEEDYPGELIRTKGYIWFADDDSYVQLFEQAGRNASVSKVSNWVASFTEKEQKEVFDQYPEVREEWDAVYGDRLNQIVFIGRGYNEETIRNKVRTCLTETK